MAGDEVVDDVVWSSEVAVVLSVMWADGVKLEGVPCACDDGVASITVSFPGLLSWGGEYPSLP